MPVVMSVLLVGGLGAMFIYQSGLGGQHRAQPRPAENSGPAEALPPPAPQPTLQPPVEPPAADTPTPDQSALEQSAAGQQTAERPSAEQPTAGQLGKDQQVVVAPPEKKPSPMGSGATDIVPSETPS